MFAVDIEARCARFVDLLRAIRCEPASNRFSLLPEDEWTSESPARFIEQINRADLDLAAKHADIPATLSARERLYSSVDPRLDAEISVVGGVERVTIRAKEDVPLSLALKLANDSERDAMRDAMAYGASATVRAEELRIAGSPLFTDLQFRTITVEGERTHHLIRVGAVRPGDPSDSSPAIMVRGYYTRGTHGLDFVIGQDDCLASFRFRWHADRSLPPSITIANNLGKWRGRSIREIPSAESVARVVESYSRGAGLSLALLKDSEFLHLVAGSLKSENAILMAEFANYFRDIARLRHLCAHFGWDSCLVGCEYRRSEATRWSIAYEAIIGGPVEVVCETIAVVPRMPCEDEDGRQPVSIHVPLDITMGGARIGEVPVLITLDDFRLNLDRAGSVVSITALNRRGRVVLAGPQSAPPRMC